MNHYQSLLAISVLGLMGCTWDPGRPPEDHTADEPRASGRPDAAADLARTDPVDGPERPPSEDGGGGLADATEADPAGADMEAPAVVELFGCSGNYILQDPALVALTLVEAIDRAVGEFAAVLRPFARVQLEQVVRVSQKMTFLPGADTMTIHTDEGQAWSSDLQGTDVVVKDGKGIPLTISRWMDGPVLHDRATRPLGNSEYEFRPAQDGLVLMMLVVTSSPRLKSAIRYEVVYQRE